MPLLVAIVAIPILIRGLGTDRFGMLSLVWVVVLNSSLLDLGMSRAITKLVAEKLGAGQRQQISQIAWTALMILFLIGLAGGLIVGLVSPWLVHSILKIPEALQSETLNALYLIGVSIPIVVSSGGFRGILAAQQRFDLVNAVRIPVGVFNLLGPLLRYFPDGIQCIHDRNMLR